MIFPFVIGLLVFLPNFNSVRWGPASNETLFQSIQSPVNLSKTTFTPARQIVNVNLDSFLDGKVQPVRAKNQTFQSIRDIINLDQEYPEDKYDYNDKPITGIDSDGNLSVNFNKLLNNSKLNEMNEINGLIASSSTPSPSTTQQPSQSPLALPQVSEYGHYPNKPSLQDCPRIPSPTLTPSLPGRPRYVKIEWRKMILPPTATNPTITQSSSSSPSTTSMSSTTNPSSHKLQLVIPNDFTPFYYRKLVDYGPSTQPHPPLMPVNHLHHSPLAPPVVKRNKKPNQMKIPKVFASLMRSKKKRAKTKRPGYIYIPNTLPTAAYPPPYYYGPVALPEREPWPVESIVKYARTINNSSDSTRKTIN
uniref:Uncharacterized protein n=1 Tax=Tetranychus urticae TaxID=32264 RepID=T1KS86_TETUR